MFSRIRSSSTIFVLAILISLCSAQRTLKWSSGTSNNFETVEFKAKNSDAINLACSDVQFSRFQNVLAAGYDQGNDNIAQATYALAACSYLRPNAVNASNGRAMAVSNLKAVVNSYQPFSIIDEGTPFRRYCYTYDLLKPDLDSTFLKAFAIFVSALISDATAWLKFTKPSFQPDNFASNIAAMRGICAQAVNNSTSVAETKVNMISYLLSPNEKVANLYQNGTSYDFYGRDALFYHLSTVVNYVDLALRMPDGFFSEFQWRLIERAIYFLKQFYLPVCQPACVYHREFVASQYKPDMTTLHGDLYQTLWPGPNNLFMAENFMALSQIPFVSVRPWNSLVDTLVHARLHINISVLACTECDPPTVPLSLFQTTSISCLPPGPSLPPSFHYLSFCSLSLSLLLCLCRCRCIPPLTPSTVPSPPSSTHFSLLSRFLRYLSLFLILYVCIIMHINLGGRVLSVIF